MYCDWVTFSIDVRVPIGSTAPTEETCKKIADLLGAESILRPADYKKYNKDMR